MWFIIALIAGATLGVLVLLLRNQNIRVSWYEWLIGIVGLLVLLFTIQSYIGFSAESANDAAATALWLMGIPAIVLMGVAAFLAWRRNRAVA
jgi:hypothetical protein